MRSLMALALLLALCVAAPARAADEATQFDVLPAPGSTTDEHDSYFRFETTPGRPTRQAISVSNPGRSTLTLVLRAVGTSTGPLGGVTYDAASTGARTPAVSWLRLERSRLILKPGATEVVPFTVLLPNSAQSGHHLAGISVERYVPAETNAPSTSAASAGVAVRTRRIIAVQAIAPGPLHADLQIDGVTAVPRPDGMHLAMQLRNAGNVLFKGRGTITVEGDQGVTRTFSIDTFVPSSAIGYPIRWTAEPRQGSFPASVEIEYEGKIVRWTGDVQVTDLELHDYVDRAGTDAANVDWLWYVLVTGVALLLVPFGWAVVRARRARSDRSTGGDWAVD